MESRQGYGFVTDDSGGPDQFVHASALQRYGLDPEQIKIGTRLSFQVDNTKPGSEVLLCQQMVATHEVAMTMLTRAKMADGLPQMQESGNLAFHTARHVRTAIPGARQGAQAAAGC